jgi:hypothetical protein
MSAQQLSPRELRVFEALGRGLQNKEIAQLLGLSRYTVESYRKTISAKLELCGPELVRAAALHRCPAGPPEHGLNRGEKHWRACTLRRLLRWIRLISAASYLRPLVGIGVLLGSAADRSESAQAGG